MNTRPGLGRLARASIAALALAAWVAGCGGGGGVGEGGTGNGYTQGAITGFGSIFVDDVRFDDSVAAVLDADGRARSRDELRLGMTVEVESDAIATGSAGSSATATHIRFGSELLGPVTSIDANAGTLTMLGQTVRVGAATVLDERLSGGLAAIQIGQVLEVYANFDPATGRYRATRIEPASAAGEFRLRGIVSALDTAAKRFRIGTADCDYAGASSVPAGLASGSLVRVNLQRGGALNGRWSVLSFGSGVNPPPDGHDALVRGFVTSFTSMQSFSVDGHPVNASGANFPDGAVPGPGARLEVKGVVSGGVLQASRVSIRTDRQEDQQLFQLIGSIASVDATGRTFQMRGVTVGFGHPGMRMEMGSMTDIVAGRQVQVSGALSGDGTRLEATLISFGH